MKSNVHSFLLPNLLKKYKNNAGLILQSTNKILTVLGNFFRQWPINNLYFKIIKQYTYLYFEYSNFGQKTKTTNNLLKHIS